MPDIVTERRAMLRETGDRRKHPREPFVEFHDLFKAYGVKQVLRGASLNVYRGEVLVILGGSGTGKSVTLRHMLGLEVPDSGRVVVEEEDITDLPEEELYRVRKKFGMLFQSGALFDSMTVFENVAFPLREHTDMSDAEIERASPTRLRMPPERSTGIMLSVPGKFTSSSFSFTARPISSSGRSVMSSSSTMTRPASGTSSPSMCRSVTDLPVPEPPRITSTSPRKTCTLAPRRTCLVP